MSAERQVGALAGRMKQVGDGLVWAKIPPPCGARGSRWEISIVELAESGDPRFLSLLAEHVEQGVIRSERARAALEAAGYDAVAA